MRKPWFLKVDWREFRIGWRRRSAPILDYAGCPMWLIKQRCRPMKGWGTLLRYLAEQDYPLLALYHWQLDMIICRNYRRSAVALTVAVALAAIVGKF
jgi:hypothetical protein